VIANASVPQSSHGFRWKALSQTGFRPDGPVLSQPRAEFAAPLIRRSGLPAWHVSFHQRVKRSPVANVALGKAANPNQFAPKGATLNESSLEVKRRIAVPGICRNYIQSPPTWLASRRCGFFVVRTTSPNLESSVGQVLKAARQSLLQTRPQVGRSSFILGTDCPDLRA
jgi:hypothetical protein